jgi:CubicO group peptidase (beta-lactamase class C family)
MKIFLIALVTTALAFNLTEPIDKLFERWNTMNSPGASVMIIKDSNILFQKQYGSASLDFNVPISTKSVFPVASISKQFTCMCIALLQEEGKLSASDDVRKYIPEIPDYGHKITIDHLMRHTSGLRDLYTLASMAGEGGLFLRDEAYHLNLIYRQKSVSFIAGDRYEYCSSGYLLLSEIIKRVSGMQLADFAKKHIFDRLGMSTAHYKINHRTIVKHQVQGYAPIGTGFRKALSIIDIQGPGGIQMNINDFIEWDRNFYKNILGRGSSDLIRTTIQPGRLNNGQILNYAYGLIVGGGRISHSGGWDGVSTHFVRYDAHKTTIVIFSNLGGMPIQDLEKSIAKLLGIESIGGESHDVNENPMKTLQSVKPTHDLRLAEYIGFYYSRELITTYQFVLEGGKLSFDLRNQGKFSLERLTGDLFRFPMGTISFLRKDGKITGIHVSVQSVQKMEFVKTTLEPIC